MEDVDMALDLHDRHKERSPQTDLGVDLVDMPLDAFGRGVVLRHVRPAHLRARVPTDLFVLIAGRAADAVGADHLVALEDRRTAAGGDDLAVGEDRGVHRASAGCAP